MAVVTKTEREMEYELDCPCSCKDCEASNHSACEYGTCWLAHGEDE